MPKFGKKKEKEQDTSFVGGIKQAAKDALRVAKINKLIEAIILIALGLVLFIWSQTALDVICMVIAAMLAILGVVVIVMYFFGRSNVYGSAVGLFAGVIAVVLGLYLFFNPVILESLGPIIVGMIILVTGLVDLSEAFRIAKQKSGGQIAALVIAVLEIVFGVIFILHPSFLNAIIMKLMAICLIADGVADIWVMFQIGKSERVVKKAVGAVEDAVKEAVDNAAAVGGNFVDGEAAGAAGDAAAETAEAERAEGRGFGSFRTGAAGSTDETSTSGAEGSSGTFNSSSQNGSQTGGYTEIPHGHVDKKQTTDQAKADAENKSDDAENKNSDAKDAGIGAEAADSAKIPSADGIATEIPPEDGPTRQD